LLDVKNVFSLAALLLREPFVAAVELDFVLAHDVSAKVVVIFYL
jgi:hypothetical protein